MIHFTGADLTVNANGITLEFEIPASPTTEVTIYGPLTRFWFLGDFVNLTLGNDDVMIPKGKPIRASYDDVRAWLLREDDKAVRDLLLDAIAEHDGQAVMFA